MCVWVSIHSNYNGLKNRRNFLPYNCPRLRFLIHSCWSAILVASYNYIDTSHVTTKNNQFEIFNWLFTSSKQQMCIQNATRNEWTNETKRIDRKFSLLSMWRERKQTTNNGVRCCNIMMAFCWRSHQITSQPTGNGLNFLFQKGWWAHIHTHTNKLSRSHATDTHTLLHSLIR